MNATSSTDLPSGTFDNIMQATSSPGLSGNCFDQATQGNTPIGPEPESPSSPPDHFTDGEGVPG